MQTSTSHCKQDSIGVPFWSIMKKKLHDLKELPLMGWRWGGETRRDKNNLRKYEHFYGMASPSKYLFVLTKWNLKKKKWQKRQWSSLPSRCLWLSSFFLQLLPRRVSSRTECYHPKIRTKTTREHIWSAKNSQKNSCVRQCLLTVDQHMNLMFMSCFCKWNRMNTVNPFPTWHCLHAATNHFLIKISFAGGMPLD